MNNVCCVSFFVAIAIITSFQSANLNAQVTPGTEVPSLEALFNLTEPGQGRAAYDPRTGEVFASIGSSDVQIFGIGNSVLSSIFSLENLSSETGLGLLGQREPNEIGTINFDGLPTGVFNLGPILQPDPNILTAADFATEFPDLSVISGDAGGTEFESRVNVLLVAVPEPSSFIGLMTLAVAGCCTRRRQR